jgi:hypothetical protein
MQDARDATFTYPSSQLELLGRSGSGTKVQHLE